MFRRAQDRIRSYFYKTRADLLKMEDLPANHLNRLLDELQKRLKKLDYFGCYFDRSYNTGDQKMTSICDETGTFLCQGRWNKEICLYKPVHSINPYSTKEERIIFQIWNLDHRIERSRAVIPAICTALQQLISKSTNGKVKHQIDAIKIFDDLFSLNNLKFVHTICHDKSIHAGEMAGPYFI